MVAQTLHALFLTPHCYSECTDHVTLKSTRRSRSGFWLWLGSGYCAIYSFCECALQFILQDV